MAYGVPCKNYKPLLVINKRHLRNVLIEYIDYYNLRRPHQGLAQQSPIQRPFSPSDGKVMQRKVLGDIINDYYQMPTTLAV